MGYNEMHELFGNGPIATRVINTLMRNGFTTEEHVRNLTPADLADLRGFGDACVAFVEQSLAYVDQQRR